MMLLISANPVEIKNNTNKPVMSVAPFLLKAIKKADNLKQTSRTDLL